MLDIRAQRARSLLRRFLILFGLFSLKALDFLWETTPVYLVCFVSRSHLLNPFTPDCAKSKIEKVSKITNWLKLKNK